jgi:hypothetical protein
MGPLSEAEYKELLQHSELNQKYKDAVNPQSAFEILEQRMVIPG